MTSSKQVDTPICHTIMCRDPINFLYNPGHMTLWCLEVVPVVYARVWCGFTLMSFYTPTGLVWPNCLGWGWIGRVRSSVDWVCWLTLPYRCPDWQLFDSITPLSICYLSIFHICNPIIDNHHQSALVIAVYHWWHVVFVEIIQASP